MRFIVLCIGAFAISTTPDLAGSQTTPLDLGSRPALAEAVQRVRTDLALSDDQASKARALITERLTKAEAAVEAFGDISLDSVLDLLNEARSI